MVVVTTENFHILREHDFAVYGFRAKLKKRVERMEVGDRMLFYLSREQRFPATVTASLPIRNSQTTSSRGEIAIETPSAAFLRIKTSTWPSRAVTPGRKRHPSRIGIMTGSPVWTASASTASSPHDFRCALSRSARAIPPCLPDAR